MPNRDVGPHVMDVHADPIANASWDFFFAFFRELQSMGKTVVVEGGWAVAAYGSPVASVDLDVLVEEGALDGDYEFYNLLHGEGRFARDDILSMVDWNYVDFNQAWASPRGYHRAEVLKNRTRQATVRSPDGRMQTIMIPNVDALLVMKLKALRDRELQVRVMQDPAEIASHDPQDIATVHPDGAYRLRKAAKDLVDVGYLWRMASHAEQTEAIRILHANELRPLLVETFTRMDALVMSAADYLIELHSLPDSARQICSPIRERL